MNKCVQDIKLNCKNKHQFIKYCAEYRAFSLQSLCELMGISRASLYKLISHFELNDDDKAKLTRKKMHLEATAATFAETMNFNLDDVGCFYLLGVRFYLHHTNKVDVYRSYSNDFKLVSELTKEDGKEFFYFNDRSGKRHTVSKPRFMYCYFSNLTAPPKGKYIEAKDGIWWKKSHLVRKDRSNLKQYKQYEKFVNEAKALHDKGGLGRREFLECVDNFFDSL